MATSSKLPVIVGGVVIVAVAVGTLLVQRRIDLPPVPDPVQVPEREEVPSTTASAAVSERARPVTTRRPDHERVAAARHLRRDQREAHVERTARAKADAITRFEREPVDPAWAPQHERALTAIAEQSATDIAGIAPKRLAVDCKSSMCRLDGQFASNSAAEDWIVVYMSSVGSNLPNAIVSREANPDGTTSVRIYGRGR